MQREYLAIGDESVNNGNYLLAVFKMIPIEGMTLEDVATEIAAESSTGTNLKVGSATPFSLNLNAKIYKIDEEQNLVWIAYPWAIFDSGGNIQNILTYIAGNILGVSEIKACKLLDVYFPPEMLVQYDGPSYSIDDMRDYLKVYDTPILGTIIKPKIGLTSAEYAELCYDFWVGGGHFVKNDEPQADQYFCPFEKMVDAVRMAMDRAENRTGQAKVHSFNVSSADYDTMLKRADYVVSNMKPGSYALLIDGITAGWMAVQTLRRHYPNVFIHFHRAGHGAFTREENPIGFTVPVLTKFARLAGASGVHTGTAGVGKMAGNPKIDILAANQGLRYLSQGDFFEQPWTRIPAKDGDVKQVVDYETKFWNSPLTGQVADREAKQKSWMIPKDDWRFLHKTAPIISGGLNPILMLEFLQVMGTIDFITTMGGGVHSHPGGTQAGAKAVMQAYEAWKSGVTVEEYARDREELRTAITFFDKNGTQAHKLHKLKGYEEV